VLGVVIVLLVGAVGFVLWQQYIGKNVEPQNVQLPQAGGQVGVSPVPQPAPTPQAVISTPHPIAPTPQNSPASIPQLTKAQVLNGYDLCGNQFKNGVFEFHGGYQAWSEWDLSRYKEGKISCPPYEEIFKDQLIFADLDNDGVFEAIAPFNFAVGSSGQGLYVFKNVNGVAYAIDADINLDKRYTYTVSANNNIIVADGVNNYDIGLAPIKISYRIANGKLVKQ